MVILRDRAGSHLDVAATVIGKPLRKRSIPNLVPAPITPVPCRLSSSASLALTPIAGPSRVDVELHAMGALDVSKMQAEQAIVVRTAPSQVRALLLTFGLRS